MENKESYTPKEMEEGFEAYIAYEKAWKNYALAFTQNFEELEEIESRDSDEMFANQEKVRQEYFEKFNESVLECEKKIPKSLIDKLGIKKEESVNKTYF